MGRCRTVWPALVAGFAIACSGDSPPGAPRNVVGVAVSSSSIEIAWSESSDQRVARYLVYRGESLLGSTTRTTYTDTGLAASTRYCYTVVAVDGGAQRSAVSATVCATTATPFVLDVARNGTGSGSVTSSPAGIDCGTACAASFDGDSRVTLTATAASGSGFMGWQGCTVANGPTCIVRIAGATTVTATFEPLALLTVIRGGAGSGSVTSSPPGIDCGADCSEPYLLGTTVTLTATTASGSGFLGWQGCPAADGTTCKVQLTADTTVVAIFSPLPVLTVIRDGTGVGTVTSSPPGIDCGADCTEPYPSGTAVTLTATAASGSAFVRWLGCPIENGPTCTVPLTADATVRAVFHVLQGLAVFRLGTGSGTVTSSPPGIDCGADCSEWYPFGTAVTLTATAASGSAFMGWQGCTVASGTTCTIEVDANAVVVATFETLEPLTVIRAGTGSGAVISSPFGIDCGTDCMESYPNGTLVTLTATTASGSVFMGWQGCPVASGKTCWIWMGGAATVTATFEVLRLLTVIRDGAGLGSVTSSAPGIDCGTDCSESYPNGTTVVLTATAVSGSGLLAWQGCPAANGTACTVPMTADTTVRAVFEPLQLLTVVRSGTGSGTVTSSLPGIDCGADCSESYPRGTAVTLSATAASGSGFAGWQGCPAASGATCTVQVTASTTVRVTFEVTNSISGKLSGDVAVGVTVSLSGARSATTTTDGTGAYSFTGLFSGAYTVTPSLAGYVFDPASRAVTLAGADLNGLDFTVSRLNRVSGNVSGDAVAGVTVSLSGAGSATTTTDGSGAYSFADLANGSYIVTPSVAGCTFEPASLTVTLASADVGGQNFTAMASEPPSAPANVSAFPGNGRTTVGWTGIATSFKVYYGLTPDVTASASSVSSAASPAVVESMANGTPYYFAVSGVNSKGEGPLSSVVCAVPTPADTTGLTLHDPLCGAIFDARKWQPHGPHWYRVEDGAALLGVDAGDLEPRHLRDGHVESGVSVRASGRRVTTLTADVSVPGASVARTGGAHVRAGVRLAYSPPAFRLSYPGRSRDALMFEVGLIDTGGGLQAFRGIEHCDDPSCGPVSTTGIAFDDPAEFVAIGAGSFRGAPAAYDATYTVTASLDEATGLFHWTVAGGSFGAGISGSADPSIYLASAPGWSGVPLAGAGFNAASILARSQDESVDGGGRGKITARFDNVLVGFDGGAASPFDDFSGTGLNSASPEFSLAKWGMGGAAELAPSGGSLRMHLQATSMGSARSLDPGIRMADPSGDVIQADVTIDSFGSTGPGSASEEVIVQGRFYNDGSAGWAPFSAVGDAVAGVALQPATNTARWWVGQCTTHTCSGALAFYQSDLIAGVTVGPGLHTVRLEWCGQCGSMFIFLVDGVEARGGLSIAVAGPARVPSREVLTRVDLPADVGTGGFVTARVNNVFTGPSNSCSTSRGSGTIALALAAAALARARRRATR